MDDLVEKIRRRLAVAGQATDLSDREPYPPTAPEHIAAAEAILGFRLPPILVRLYLEVGNGGFGPAYGLAGVDGCGADEGRNDLVALFQGQRSASWQEAFPRWPERILRIAYFGCGMHAAIDRGQVGDPVYLFEPSVEDEEQFPNALVPFERGLEPWLRAWADGEDVTLPPAFDDSETSP